jgi:dienelactone hydrolase
MMTKNAIDLAEEGGYVVVAPMGYNTGGWYGSPRGGGAGKAKAPAANLAQPPPPANLGELSEKDVMNVIAMIHKEYKIDDKRMYLMGHSMGGAGTLSRGSKHAKMWAAIAAEAPAAISMQANRAEYLQKRKDAKVPVMIVHGDMDEAVPVANSRAWADTMKEMKMQYEIRRAARHQSRSCDRIRHETDIRVFREMQEVNQGVALPV